MHVCTQFEIITSARTAILSALWHGVDVGAGSALRPVIARDHSDPLVMTLSRRPRPFVTPTEREWTVNELQFRQGVAGRSGGKNGDTK